MDEMLINSIVSWLHEGEQMFFAISAKIPNKVVKDIQEDDGFGIIRPQIWLSGSSRIPWFWSPGDQYPYHLFVAMSEDAGADPETQSDHG